MPRSVPTRALALGVNVYSGSVTNEGVAAAHGLDATPLESVVIGAGVG